MLSSLKQTKNFLLILNLNLPANYVSITALLMKHLDLFCIDLSNFSSQYHTTVVQYEYSGQPLLSIQAYHIIGADKFSYYTVQYILLTELS